MSGAATDGAASGGAAAPRVEAVRWSASLRVPDTAEPPRALFGVEPHVVLGAERVPPLAVHGVRPDRQTCFGPRGAALLGVDGPLWVADTGHHRLLGWRRCPEQDLAPADWVIGQADFVSESRNGNAAVGPASCNVPTGLCAVGNGGLALADAWNHRVLVWLRAPEASHVPADLVLGQPDFTSAEPNRGRELPAADSLFWPYGVAWCNGCLLVADAENRRVLLWHGLPQHSGQPADLVLGQPDFARRDENAGSAPDAASMRWPHALAWWRGHLCVADAGNNRVLVYRGLPASSGQAADHVLGQASTALVDHNQSLYWPRASTLNMPYGVAALGDWLVVADTANSRLLGFHADHLATGASASALVGQVDFHQKGDNRWQAPRGDSLCWPYGVSACGDGRLVVADSGNNRVSIWQVAP
jgi:hypothetical protein